MVKTAEGDAFLYMNETLARVLAYAPQSDNWAEHLREELIHNSQGVRTLQEIDRETGGTILRVRFNRTGYEFIVDGIDHVQKIDPQVANSLYQERFANERRWRQVPYEGPDRRNHE